MTVTDRRQTRSLVREGATQRQHSNFQTEYNIWLRVPEWTWHQDILTDWPSVVTWLWLWLHPYTANPVAWGAQYRYNLLPAKQWHEKMLEAECFLAGFRAVGPRPQRKLTDNFYYLTNQNPRDPLPPIIKHICIYKDGQGAKWEERGMWPADKFNSIVPPHAIFWTGGFPTRILTPSSK
jgi:hypothetical protein